MKGKSETITPREQLDCCLKSHTHTYTWGIHTHTHTHTDTYTHTYISENEIKVANFSLKTE